jgi:hypothetical protein
MSDLPVSVLTEDLTVDRVIRTSNIAGRLRFYVVVDDELRKVDPNGFRILSRDGATLSPSVDVKLIRTHVQWPYAIAQLGESDEVMMVALRVSLRKTATGLHEICVVVGASVRVGLEDVRRSILGYLNPSTFKLAREGARAPTFTTSGGPEEQSVFMDQVDEMIKMIVPTETD